MKKIKYVKYTEVEKEDTTLAFNEMGVDVEVKKIAPGYAVLFADTVGAINTVIDAQSEEISVSIITKDLFVDATSNSQTVKAIESAVDMRIRDKYTLGDELSMNHKLETSASKIAYLAFRQEQIDICKEQKAELGL